MKAVEIRDVNRPLTVELPVGTLSRNIAVVVPTFKGKDHLEDFLRNLTTQLSELDLTYVIIVIDDGSPRTLAPDFETIVRQFDNVIVGALYKRRGQHFATRLGVSLLAHCDLIVTIDDDLMIDSFLFRDILTLFSNPEIDLMFAKSSNSVKNARRIISQIVSFLVRKFTSHNVPLIITSTRAFRGYLVELLPHPDPMRYLSYDLMNAARKPIQMKLNVLNNSLRPSTYRLRDLFKHLSRLVLNHDEWLVKLISLIAIPFCFVLGTLGTYFTLDGALTGIHVRGWLSLFLLTSLIGSINFLCVALLGKYLGSVMRQLSRPQVDTKILLERVRFFYVNEEVN